MNPAALSAIARGDLANALVASTPGGIERQEAQGQRDLVASSRLPKEIRGATREEITAATGIVFGADADDLFVNVTLPPGWKLQATEHNMHSDLLDDQGRKRAGVFYKAAFYDRRADIHFNRRYRVDNNFGDPTTTIIVLDTATGETLRTVGQYAYRDYAAAQPLEDLARAWLKEHFPDYENALAYWGGAQAEAANKPS